MKKRHELDLASGDETVIKGLDGPIDFNVALNDDNTVKHDLNGFKIKIRKHQCFKNLFSTASSAYQLNRSGRSAADYLKTL